MSDGKGLASILEGTIREIVRQEVTAALTDRVPTSGHLIADSQWMTPPQAARKTGIPVKTIRNMIKEGVIGWRARNASQNPTQKKYLVCPEDVAAVAGRSGAADVGGQISVEEEADRILAELDSRR